MPGMLVRVFAIILSLLILTALSACDTGVAPAGTATPVPSSPTTSPLPAAQATVVEPTDTPLSTSERQSPVRQPTGTDTSAAERLIFLDPDGVTIRRMDIGAGSVEQIGVIDKPDWRSIVALIADPTGDSLVYGLGEEGSVAMSFHPWGSGQVTSYGAFLAPPRLSPDGRWLAGQLVGEEGLPGAIHLIELATGEGRTLPERGLPDWFPDGRRLVFVWESGVYSYDLESEQSTPLVELPNDEQDAWNVQEAHVLPNGEGIIFFGSHFRQDGQLMIGASGNGQQWWWVAEEGGEPRAWTEPEGSGVQALAVSPSGERLAYAYTAHSSACVSIQAINVVNAQREPGKALSPVVPELEPRENGAAYFRGVTWSPRGDSLRFGVQAYTCPEDGSSVEYGVPVIYSWDIESGAYRKLVEGSFPNWVR